MSPTESSRVVPLAVLLLVGTSALMAGCASVQQTTTTGTDSTTQVATTTRGVTATTSGTSTANRHPRQWTVTITRIVDGDTVEFRYENGTTDTGRLLGVDTPEVHTANDPAEFEGVPNDTSGARCLRDWGHKASEFARTELAGERVTVFLDPNEGPRDRYDRLLIYLRDDGRLFNYRLVTQGYARVYDSKFTKRDRFYSAESKARREKIGLWECRVGSGTTRTAERAGGTTALSIARIHADAAGNDHDNLNDEYVVVKNVGGERLDISDWTISDAAAHTYRVPSGVTLASGRTVTLHTGSGSDSSSDLYWGSESAVWNNGGDTILVRTADGTVVVRRAYSG